MKTIALLIAALFMGGCASSVMPSNSTNLSSSTPPTSTNTQSATSTLQSPPNHYSVAIDPALPADDINYTLQALAVWTADTSVIFNTVIAACTTEGICIAGGPSHVSKTPILNVYTGEIVAYELKVTGEYGSCTYTNFGYGGVIEYNATSDDLGPMFLTLAEHEIGHAMGLAHHEGPDNVMNAAIQLEAGPSADDVAQFMNNHVEAGQNVSDVVSGV